MESMRPVTASLEAHCRRQSCRLLSLESNWNAFAAALLTYQLHCIYYSEDISDRIEAWFFSENAPHSAPIVLKRYINYQSMEN